MSRQHVEVSAALSPVLPFSFEGSDSHRDGFRGKEHIWYVWVVTQPSVTKTSGKVSTPGQGERQITEEVWVCECVLMQAVQDAVTEQSVLLWQ